MNLLSNLWASLVRTPAPPPKPMITSVPIAAPEPAPQPDTLRLAKPPSLNLHLTQGSAMAPLLVANNSAGLKPRPKGEITNTAPADVSPSNLTPHAGARFEPLFAVLSTFWSRLGRPA